MARVRLCRLCLKKIERFGRYQYLKKEDSVNENKNNQSYGINFDHMLKENLPELNMNLTKCPVICNSCADQFVTAGIFKYQVQLTEQKVGKLISTGRNYVVLRDLVDDSIRKLSKPVCRACLTFVRGNHYQYLNANGNEYLRVKIKECINMDFAASLRPVICQVCIKQLETYCSFRKRCLQTELVIKQYLHMNKLKPNSIDLAGIQNVVQLIKFSDSFLESGRSEIAGVHLKDILETARSQMKRSSNVGIKTEFEKELSALGVECSKITSSSNNVQNAPLIIKQEKLDEEEMEQCNEDIFTITTQQNNGAVLKNETRSSVDEIPSTSMIEICGKCIKFPCECEDKKTDKGKKTYVWYKCDGCPYQTRWKHHLRRHKNNKNHSRIVKRAQNDSKSGWFTQHDDCGQEFEACLSTSQIDGNLNGNGESNMNEQTQTNSYIEIKSVDDDVDIVDVNTEIKQEIMDLDEFSSEYTPLEEPKNIKTEKMDVPEFLFEEHFLSQGNTEEDSDSLLMVSGTESVQPAETEFVNIPLPDQLDNTLCVQKCIQCLNQNVDCFHNKRKTLVYKCLVCNYETNWKHHLVRHKQVHEKDPEYGKTYSCKQCAFQSPFKHSLVRHSALAHGDSLKCSHCEFNTQFKSTLNKHMQEAHGVGDTLYKCSQCSYTSKWKYHVKRHMITHSK